MKSNFLLYLALLLCSILVFAFGKVYETGVGPAISKRCGKKGTEWRPAPTRGPSDQDCLTWRREDYGVILTVFKYLKGYYIEDEKMFFTSTGEQIKGNSFKLCAREKVQLVIKMDITMKKGLNIVNR